MQLKVVAFFKIREYTKRYEVKNLGQQEKLFDRLLSHPKDFTSNDAEALIGYINYRRSNKERPVARAFSLCATAEELFQCTNRIHKKS